MHKSQFLVVFIVEAEQFSLDYGSIWGSGFHEMPAAGVQQCRPGGTAEILFKTMWEKGLPRGNLTAHEEA